jgi:thiamine-monophosphate kinase
MNVPAQTVGEIGERAIIERIRARVPPPPAWVAIGIGDDAAVLRPERNRAEVITTDALVEGVHFDRAYVPAAAIGHKALAVNLSDLAAMGAEPRSALLSLVLPAALPVADLDAMVDGLLALAARHAVSLVGGNIARSPGPLVLDVTATGVVKPRRVLTRAGARPGDDVYVSGEIGMAAAGFALLSASARKNGLVSARWNEASQLRSALSPEGASTLPDRRIEGLSRGASGEPSACEQRFLMPEPRVRLGQLLGRSGIVSSCIDLSDGLADAVRQVADASGVGAIVEAAAIPVPDAARAALGGGDEGRWLEAALAGGEDYELLFTASPRRRRSLDSVLRHAQGLPCTRIGRITRDRRLVLRRSTGDGPIPGGFVHFR